MYEKFQSTKDASRNFPPKHYIHNASGFSTTVLNLSAEKEPSYEKDYFGKTYFALRAIDFSNCALSSIHVLFAFCWFAYS